MTRPADLSNMSFGMLTVVSRLENDRNRKARWLCACSCGASSIVRASDLAGGKIISCGCLRNKKSGARTYVHGRTRTRLYYVWQGIKARCFNPKNVSYKNYGGRGITMCARWENSFADFLADMGDRPTSHHSIDRINNDGNYEPSNCRWATRLEQSKNRRREQHAGTRIVHEMEAA